MMGKAPTPNKPPAKTPTPPTPPTPPESRLVRDEDTKAKSKRG